MLRKPRPIDQSALRSTDKIEISNARWTRIVMAYAISTLNGFFFFIQITGFQYDEC